jgi:hypothetical protein
MCVCLCPCWLQAGELEWGSPGCESAVHRLSLLKPDLVLAADCCYIDQDGQSPSTPHFIQACKGGGGGDGEAPVC